MPDIEAGALTPVEQVHYRQALMPNHMTGSFEGDDQDYHDFRFSGRGKNIIGFWIDNPTNQTLTWELYGLHAVDSLSDAPGAEKIDEGSILTTANTHDYTYDYPYPFYLLRLYFGTKPTDDPVEVVQTWIDLKPIVLPAVIGLPG